LFAALPETQSFLSETNFYKPCLNYLSSNCIAFRLLEVLKCSPPILHILDSEGLIPRLLALLNSTTDDNYFSSALALYEFCLSTSIPSAIAAAPAVIDSFSTLALDVKSGRQWSVLNFLKTAIHFCGNQLIENGIIQGIVRNSLEFPDSKRSLALQLLADFANTEFVGQLINFGVIPVFHQALELVEEGASIGVSILSLIKGVVSSGLGNARLITKAFVGGEIAEFLGNGNYDEKIAATEVVLRMFEFVMELEIAKYLETMPLVPQLVDLLESQFAPVRRAILGSLLCLKGAAERGVLYKPLKEQFEELSGDNQCLAAIQAVVEAEDCEPEVRDMALALLKSDCE
jgi:hypothetical protein